MLLPVWAAGMLGSEALLTMTSPVAPCGQTEDAFWLVDLGGVPSPLAPCGQSGKAIVCVAVGPVAPPFAPFRQTGVAFLWAVVGGDLVIEIDGEV